MLHIAAFLNIGLANVTLIPVKFELLLLTSSRNWPKVITRHKLVRVESPKNVLTVVAVHQLSFLVVIGKKFFTVNLWVQYQAL